VHDVIIIANVALPSLHSVITTSEMLLRGPATAPCLLAVEVKTPLIPAPHISFPGSCAQAQLRFARLSLPDLICSLLMTAACPAHPEQGAWACCPSCSASASQTPLCSSGWGPNLASVPLWLLSKGICASTSGNHPHPKGSTGHPGYSCLLEISEHHFSPMCQAEFPHLGNY